MLLYRWDLIDFQKLFFADAQISQSQQILTAFVAGAGSALVRCPTDLVMTHRRLANNNFYYTARRLVQSRGLSYLFTGFLATAVRSGMFAMSFLAAKPIIKNRLQQYYPDGTLTSLMAGVIAGAGSAIITQGLDTLSVTQQAYVGQKSIGILEAAKKVYSKNGFYSFFKGSIPRGTRTISAVIIMSSVNEKMESLFQKQKLSISHNLQP